MSLNWLKKYFASSSLLCANDGLFVFANFDVELSFKIVFLFLSTISVHIYLGTSLLIFTSIVLLKPLRFVIGWYYDLNSRLILLVGSVVWTAPNVFFSEVAMCLHPPYLRLQKYLSYCFFQSKCLSLYYGLIFLIRFVLLCLL